MVDQGGYGGVPSKELAALAELYDRHANNLEPISQDAKDAKRRFDFELNRIIFNYYAGPDEAAQAWRFGLISACRQWLRKNGPPPPSAR